MIKKNNNNIYINIINAIDDKCPYDLIKNNENETYNKSIILKYILII